MEIHVVTSRQRYDDAAAQLPASDLVQGVHVHRVWTSRFGRDWLPGRAVDYLSYYLSVAWCLLRLLEKNNVVVAKTDPPLISIVAAVVSKLRGARQVNWIQDLFPEVAMALNVRGMDGWFGGFLKKWRNSSLRFAKANVVLGERMGECLRSEGVRDNIVVIPNWADGDAIRPLAHEENALRKAWGLTDRFVVCYSGNMGRVHEFGTILDAAELLKNEQGPVFLFIGGGPRRGQVAEEVTARGLSNVMFQSYQARERLRESLGVADVHVVSLLPSMEGLIVPSKFYGIAAAGRPTLFIGDVNGEVPAVLGAEHCGVALQIGNSAGLRDAIKTLIDDEAGRIAMGERARCVFERQFDKPVALIKWRDLLEKVMNEGR